MKNKKILFPTDFTDQSIQALKHTVELNKNLGFEIIIFHAYFRPYEEGFDLEGKLKKTEQDVEQHFQQLPSKIPDLKSQNHSFKKALGDLIDSVVEMVETDSIGLIVMSTKGAVGLGELFGTKTAKIIKSVSIPVIVVPTDASLMPVEKISLACDYAEEIPLPKLDLLVYLSEKMHLDLDLITLNRDEKTMTKKELKNRENLMNNLSNLPVKVSFTDNAHLPTGLIRHAKSNNINMIGIIPKSYNFMERIFHESLTQDMAFLSPIPVLVLQ